MMDGFADLDYPELTDAEIMALSDKMRSGVRKIIEWGREKYPQRNSVPPRIIDYLADAANIKEEVDRRIIWRAIIRS